MRYVKILGLSLMASLVCCLGVSASASAVLGPQVGVCLDNGLGTAGGHCLAGEPNEHYEAKLLSSTETLLVLGLQLNTQKLETSTPADEISCSTLHAHGYLVGGSPAKDFETLQYSGCTVPSSSSCTVNSVGAPGGSIDTEPLESEIVFTTEAGAKELKSRRIGHQIQAAIRHDVRGTRINGHLSTQWSSQS